MPSFPVPPDQALHKTAKSSAIRHLPNVAGLFTISRPLQRHALRLAGLIGSGGLHLDGMRLKT
jgi:hypothetical protein